MRSRQIQPFAVYSDGKGNIYEDRNLFAVGRSGHEFYPLYLDEMIPLPEGSDLFELPGRSAIGYSRNGKLTVRQGGLAAAAFIAPAHTQLSVAAWESKANAPVLPLFAYTAVGWYANRFYVPAIRIDPDTRQDCNHFDQKVVVEKGNALLLRHEGNRLVEHLVENCAFTYLCPAARNMVMGRWEAPIPVSPTCNARCIGCISKQDKQESPIPETQHRLTFVPTVEEIAGYAIPHLENAPNAVVSFGQGCEGEPLMQWELIRDAIKFIRSKTQKGVVNLNTNGSKPRAVEELFKAGLDSIRVSMNSAQPQWYESYFRPTGFSQNDAIESLSIARKYNRWASINYFVMPGFTDTPEELAALKSLIGKTNLSMIQWRNLNIDPDWLFGKTNFSNSSKPLGIKHIMDEIHSDYPSVYFGYFNPPYEVMQQWNQQVGKRS